jgi:hypothetical protein
MCPVLIIVPCESSSKRPRSLEIVPLLLRLKLFEEFMYAP